ncbi:hypothetical protein PIB30_003047 [Stylosanthes scabra]|uniref:Uncharacterized protein n=1 Tax=Stylosanthes scabra TaxID=79078 RepID=A0ABU6X506_9FABA|nr:hypothetical protein [Stylosanthes scabra]
MKSVAGCRDLVNPCHPATDSEMHKTKCEESVAGTDSGNGYLMENGLTYFNPADVQEDYRRFASSPHAPLSVLRLGLYHLSSPLILTRDHHLAGCTKRKFDELFSVEVDNPTEMSTQILAGIFFELAPILPSDNSTQKPTETKKHETHRTHHCRFIDATAAVRGELPGVSTCCRLKKSEREPFLLAFAAAAPCHRRSSTRSQFCAPPPLSPRHRSPPPSLTLSAPPDRCCSPPMLAQQQVIVLHQDYNGNIVTFTN